MTNPAEPSRVYAGTEGDSFDAFVAKVSPSGEALAYSTYLGGGVGDVGLAIAVDLQGNAHVTGWTRSIDFPVVDAGQPVFGGVPFGSTDAFVARLDPTGSALTYSTYLGGSSNDMGRGIAVDLDGNAYIAGETQSIDFPVVNALQPTFRGGLNDGFVVKIGPGGTP